MRENSAARVALYVPVDRGCYNKLNNFVMHTVVLVSF